MGARRALRYIQQSMKWVHEINKASAPKQDEDGDDADGSGADTFMYEWLVSQQLLAALEFAPQEADVWGNATMVALEVLTKTGENAQEFPPGKVRRMLDGTCRLSADRAIMHNKL